MKLVNANRDYTAIADEIGKIREMKQQLLVDKVQTEGLKARIAELKEFIGAADQELIEYDESLVRKYIEKKGIV